MESKKGKDQLTPEAQAIEALFYIQNKRGSSVPFTLNASQRAYDLQRTKRDIIAKARQKGFSSLGIAYQVIDCLGKEGTRAVLISHEAKATQRLLDRARYYLKHMNGPKPVLGRHSRNELYFPKTESSLYIGTAGAKAFGRGDTITHLHISEYAWWESDALKQVAGLFQAVPKDGTIRIESTGNGRTNDYYFMCQHAPELGYNLFFRAWWQDDEYTLTPKHKWQPEGFENYFQDMKTTYNLTEEQLYWYWVKLLEFRRDLKMMQQEYPSCLEECFQATGGSVFPNVQGKKHYYWTWSVKHTHRMEHLSNHPARNRTYVIGADPSGGTGHDDAACQIICLETLEQVLEFAYNQIDPVDFGYLLCNLGFEYNDAFITCESNNHGIATHSILYKNYPLTKIYKRRIPTGRFGKPIYGYATTQNSKAGLVGAIHECMQLGLSVYGKKTINELQTFEETPEGRLEGPSDNLVIALGLACIGYLKYERFKNPLHEPIKKEPINPNDQNYMYFTFDEIFNRLNKTSPQALPRMIN
jgi:hypothetical protein